MPLFLTRTWRLVLSTIFLLLFAAGCNTPMPPLPTEHPPGATLRVAILTPMTGELATFGEAVRNGITLAFDEWNEQGGVNGQFIEWVLEDVDFVLMMSVNPGFGGQKFIPNSLDRIRKLKKMISDKGLETLIQVDGGVNAKTIGEISRAGADVFVAGSAIFGSRDYQETIGRLKKEAALLGSRWV